MKQKLLVLDGNSILNRAFYGIRNLSTSAGLPTNAVYGFMNILHKHMESVTPTHVACAFDTKTPTFRHEKYADYKGTRKGMPDELAMQLPYAKEAADVLGFPVLTCPGWEADDILGTLAKWGEERGMDVYLLTGDRDSLQLITDTTKVILMKNGEDVLFDTGRFQDEYGIEPSQFIDVKALMGDSSDNIPGVAGIGEKTALKLISACGSLDILYGDITFGGSTTSVCKKLMAGREAAYLSRELAAIRRDAPLETDLDALVWRGVKADGLVNLCKTLEFSGMAKKFGVTDTNIPKKTAVLPPEKICTIDELPDMPLSLAVEGADVLLCDGDNLYRLVEPDKKEVLSRAFVCHDLKNLLRKTGMTDTPTGCIFDTMLAAYLLEPGKGNYPLEKILPLYDDDVALPDTPAAGETAYVIWRLWQTVEPMLAETGMDKLLADIELPLAHVLASMEETGFRIDTEGVVRYAQKLAETEAELMSAIWMAAGHDFNLNSPKQLGEVLFEELELPAGKKTKTGYSTDAETLEKLRPYHPIIDHILSYRQISKLRGTYGEPLARLADENGRIHTQLNQTGTATGRLSSNDPNLQNIPVRMELGRELRKYFIAGEDRVLVDADYSQIELRLMAHLSGDDTMLEAFRSGTDIHTKVASQVFYVPEVDVTPELRRRAKAVNFGIIYGIGEFSLSQDLHISRKQAAQYIENYLYTYPKVDRYLQNTIADAREKGYTTTMYARRRKIPELAAKNRVQQAFGERVAMNSPIQGSAADIIKIAMIRVYDALKEAGIDARLIMQVHDELIVEAAKDCAETAREILIREMENAAVLSIPLTAEAGVGESWYDAK